MRKRNWHKYNKNLVARGSLTFLLDRESFLPPLPKKKRQIGRPLAFTEAFIVMLMMIKIHYRLSYRGLEGFSRFFIPLLGHACHLPTYSLICKRAKKLATALPKLSQRRPSVVIVDASGVRVLGEGEWKVKIHGRSSPRKWMKIHIALDAKTQEVVGEVLTESRVSDGQALPTVLDQVRKGFHQVIGDGAYDKRGVREEIKKRSAVPLVPPPKNAVWRGNGDERDEAVLDIAALGGDKVAKSLWGKIRGYNLRVLVETAFSRFKRLFGDRFFSKTPDRQRVETRLKWIILNKAMGAC